MHTNRKPTTATMRRSPRTTAAPPDHHFEGGTTSRMRKIAAKQANIVSAVSPRGTRTR